MVNSNHKALSNSDANVGAGNFISVDLEAIIETAEDGAVMHDGTGAAIRRKAMSGWQIAHAITNHVRGLGETNWDDVTVEYDEKNQGFKFHQTKATPDIITIGATTAATSLFLAVCCNRSKQYQRWNHIN